MDLSAAVLFLVIRRMDMILGVKCGGGNVWRIIGGSEIIDLF